MAAPAPQQQAGAPAPQQQLYPPPPPFFRLYRPEAELLPPLPPPPPVGEYQSFGIADSTEVVLPPLMGRQLYHAAADGSIDYKVELLTLHREMVANVLELVTVLVDKPSLWARQVENVGAVLRNMQHLCNLLRPTQARQTLLHTLQEEVAARRAAAQELRDKVAQAEAALSGGAEQIAAAAAELQQAAAAAGRAAAS